MKTTILIGHPYIRSYNYAILDAIKGSGDTMVINLIEDGFDPVMKGSDLAGFSKGVYADPLVGKYQDILNNTDRLIIITPIWWYGLPAIYKGFLDKVMLKNFAYTDVGGRLQGKLGNIKETIIITTAEAPAWYIRFFGGDPIGALRKRILKDMGIKHVRWLHQGSITDPAPQKRERFLARVSALQA